MSEPRRKWKQPLEDLETSSAPMSDRAQAEVEALRAIAEELETHNGLLRKLLKAWDVREGYDTDEMGFPLADETEEAAVKRARAAKGPGMADLT